MSPSLFGRGTMRSFTSRIVSVCALTASALGAVLPRDHSVGQHHGRSSIVELDLHHGYAQATFSVPCPECLGRDDDAHGDDESLLLRFRTHAAEEPCGSSSNISVNGHFLPQEWSNNLAAGQATFLSEERRGEYAGASVLRNLDIEWETACLHAPESSTETHDPSTVDQAAQLLTISIKGVDGRPLHKPAGFTVSFTQSSPPELLRFEPIPDRSARDQVNAEAWRTPPEDLRLLPSTVQEHRPATSLTAEQAREKLIEERRTLQRQALELQKALTENEDRLLKAEVEYCGDLSCSSIGVLQIIRHTPKSVWKRTLGYLQNPVWNPPTVKEVMGRPEEARWNNPVIYQTYNYDYEYVHHHRRVKTVQYLCIALGAIISVLGCGCIVVKVNKRLNTHECPCTHSQHHRKHTESLNRHESAPYLRKSRKFRWRAWLGRRSPKDQSRIEDYEEKRRLINSQEDILEDVMKEEIRQLRCAHVMVDHLVQVEAGARRGTIPSNVVPTAPQYQHRSYHGQGYTYTPGFAGTVPTHPSAITPYHYIPRNNPYNDNPYADPPSPASSTYTSSEGYSSRPLSRSSTNSSLPPSYASSNETHTAPPAYEEQEFSLLRAAQRVADGFRSYRPRGASMGSLDSRRSQWTPDSSVVDVSPRRSAETLRFPEYEEVDFRTADE